jgi:hypothetical protein
MICKVEWVGSLCLVAPSAPMPCPPFQSRPQVWSSLCLLQCVLQYSNRLHPNPSQSSLRYLKACNSYEILDNHLNFFCWWVWANLWRIGVRNAQSGKTTFKLIISHNLFVRLFRNQFPWFPSYHFFLISKFFETFAELSEMFCCSLGVNVVS